MPFPRPATTAMPLWADLCRRHVTPEVMDRPDLDEGEHARALRGLARLNLWSGSADILWPSLLALARAAGPGGVRVLDVATGGGDVPLRLWRKARRAGVAIQLAGCDRSPVAVRAARERAAAAGADLTFFPLDVLTDPLPADYEALTCSLFLHHLDGPQAVEVLRRMAAAARRLVLVSDLARGSFGYALAWTAARLLTRSRVVHTDAPRSVAAAFTPNEAVALAWQAGMTGATVERRWPCRFLLAWVKLGPEPA
jgi:2-polyprenyl-3-methyl-5-hydroxy-6-metoxy-1,4-benzoquinol methylase